MSESTSGQMDSLWLWTGGLLLLIVVALSVLWIRERTAGLAQRRQVAELVEKLRVQQDTMALQTMLREQDDTPAVSRGDLPLRYAQFDGRQVSVLTLSAQAGRRIGFEPGDVIVVAEELPDEGDSAGEPDQP